MNKIDLWNPERYLIKSEKKKYLKLQISMYFFFISDLGWMFIDFIYRSFVFGTGSFFFKPMITKCTLTIIQTVDLIGVQQAGELSSKISSAYFLINLSFFFYLKDRIVENLLWAELSRYHFTIIYDGLDLLHVTNCVWLISDSVTFRMQLISSEVL